MARVCILLATYQGERFLRQQLDSLVAQTHRDWACVAQDDCSTDATLSILQEYAQADERFTVMCAEQRHGGAKENFFSLIAYCQEHMTDAEYFAFCDQDDIWLPEKLALSLEAIGHLEEALDGAPAAICTDAQVVAEDASEIAPSYLAYTARDTRNVEFHNLLVENMAPGCTMLMNRVCFQALRAPHEGLAAVEMHDWWAMLVASALGAVACLPQATMAYRQHGDNSLGAQRYSLSDRAAHLRETVAGVRGAHDQARVFASAYADVLPERELTLAYDFGHMLEWGPIARLRTVSRDGFWRATPGKRVVQVLLAWGLRR